MKLVCGVARGIMIVTPEWIDSSKRAHKFLGKILSPIISVVVSWNS